MRRGVAGLLFFVAAIALAVAAAGWWLQRMAFDTDVSGELADVVLEDPAIRAQIADATSNAAAATLGLPVEEVRATVELVAQTPEGAELMREVVADSHARLIGARDEPVQITGAQLVPIVRNERAAELPPVVLPVEEITALSTTRAALGWAVPIAALVGGVALLLGLVTHPRRADAVFGIGVFCLAAAVAVLLLGWVLPAYATPALSDATWLGVIPAVAQHHRTFVIVVAAALLIGGLALMITSAAARRRRSWSSPVSVHRYSDQRQWS